MSIGQTPEDRSAAQGLDLSAVRDKGTAAGQDAGPGNAGPGTAIPENAVAVPSLVFDVTEASFNDTIQLSMDVPVVFDLWADWCEPCKQLSPILSEVVTELDGAVVLAKVDVDANPQIKQLFQVQSIPTVVAVVKGQPLPLFQGALPKPQVAEAFRQLVEAAASAGVTKKAVVSTEPAEPAGPAHPEALEALERGDFAAAREVYTEALKQAPADAEAKVGLARVGLLERATGFDAAAVRAAAAEDPKSLDAALDCADLDLAGGHVDDAFARLLGFMPGAAPADKERLRVRLLELFDVVGAEDPRVTRARARLMRALF